MIREALEEAARPRLVPIEMDCFKNQSRAPLRCQKPDLRGNHRAITMSPKNSAFNSHRIEYKKSLLGRSPVKVGGHWTSETRGAPVTRPVWNHKAHIALQTLDLPVNGIYPITPPAVQKHDRLPAPHISIVNLNRPNSRRVRRVFQFHKRHELSNEHVGTAAGCPAGRSPAKRRSDVLSLARENHGKSSSFPVVFRDSRSRCACCASANGYTCSIRNLSSPSRIMPKTAPVRCCSSLGLAT